MDLLARSWGIRLSDRRTTVVLGRGERAGQDVVLAKPRTFVNRSGEAVAYLLTRFAAQPSDLVIVYDDLNLPTGKLRIRPAGSDGGHNGIRSIIATLSTQAFPRVRVGIGSPLPGQDSASYVLGQFTEAEAPIISQAIQTSAQAIDYLLGENIEGAMSRFN